MIVSIIALLISATVAAWNVLKYVLDGGRVRVRLASGSLDDHALLEGPYRSKRKNPLREPRPLSVDVGVLQVENLGRTAVTISAPSFDLGRARYEGRKMFGRHTIQTRFYGFRDHKTESVVRLEPYDYVRFLLDADSLLGHLRQEGRKRSTRVRASVMVAGKRFRCRSSWWHAWRIKPNQETLGGERLTLQQVVYRAVKQVSSDENEPPAPRLLAYQVAKAAETSEPLSEDSLREAIAGVTYGDDADLRALTLSFVVRDRLIAHGYMTRTSPDPDPKLIETPRLETTRMRPIDCTYRLIRDNGAEVTGDFTGEEASAREWALRMSQELGWDDWQLEVNDGLGWVTVLWPDLEDRRSNCES